MNLLSIFGKKPEAAGRAVSEPKIKIVDYGYPKVKETPFDFYTRIPSLISSKTENETVHVCSENCRPVIRITERHVSEYRRYGETNPYERRTYYEYVNYYKTANGNYVMQSVTPKDIDTLNSRWHFECVANKEQMTAAYISAKHKDTGFFNNYMTFSSKTEYVDLQTFDETEFENAITEW